MFLSLLMAPFTGARIAHAAAPSLNSPSSMWYATLVGAKFDPRADLQAKSTIDLLGNAGYPLLYMYYDDKGDSDGSNDELLMRVRLTGARDKNSYSGYVWMGVDVDQDGDLDVFLMLDGKNGVTNLDVYTAGTGANNSPSTSSIANPVSLATLDATTFRIDNVTAIDTSAPASFDGTANTDDFVSFKFNFQAFANIANGKPLTGGGGNIAMTKDTPLRFVLASAAQTNALNGDVGGYGAGDSSSTTYAQQGAFSSPLTFGDPGGVASPTAIGFATPDRTIAAGTASDVMTVELRNGQGSPVAATAATTVSLSAPNVTFRDAADTTTITSVTIPSGETQASFKATSTLAGTPTITASGTGLTSATQGLTVTAAAASQLAFGTQPTNAYATAPISPAVTVRLLDAYGNLTASTATVAMSLGANPGGGTLGGTTSVAAVGGVATFSDLSVSAAGTGYTLQAASAGVTEAASSPFNIAQKVLTLSGLTAQSKTYDGNPAATISAYGTLTGVTPGDGVSLDTTGATATFDTKNVGTGKTVTVTGLALSGAQAGAYAIGSQTATADITARPVTVTADAQTKPAGGPDPALTYHVTSGSLVAGESFTGALTRVPGEAAGTYAIQQGTLSAGSNYGLTFLGANLTITSGTVLTLNGLTVADKPYDGNTAATVTSYGTLSGVAAGDDVALETTGATAAFDTKNVGNGKTVTVTGLALSGAQSWKYTLGNQTTTASITALPVTVTADAQTKTVGGPDPALTYQVTVGSLVEGESFTGALTRVSGEAAGTYAIQQGTLSAGSNYSLTFVGANLTITSSTVLTLNGLTVADKPYDGNTTATVTSYGTLSGVAAGDDVALETTGATAAFDTKNVGNGKTVTVTGLALSGAQSWKYTLGNQTTTASITPTVLTIQITSHTLTSDPTPIIGGTSTAPAGSQVTVTIGGHSYTTTVQPGGTWSVQVTGPLPDGPYPVTATVQDGFGNTGSATGSLTVSTQAPVVITNGFLRVTVKTDFGMAVPGVGVQVLRGDGSVAASGVTDGNGRLDASLPPGLYTAALTMTGQTSTATAALTSGQTAEVSLTVTSTLSLSLSANPASIIGDGRSTATLTASVRTLSGQPAAGVNVVLSATAGSVSPGSAATNAGGLATSTLRAPQLSGTQPQTEQVVATVFEPSRGLFARAVITIKFLPATVTGTVIDARTGQPVAGAIVSASEDFDGDGTPDFEATFTTGPDGRYEIVVPRGDWHYTLTIKTPLVVDGKTIWVTSNQISQIDQLQGVGEQYQAEPTISGLLQIKDGADQAPKSLNAVLPAGVAVKGTIRNASGELLDKPVTISPEGVFQVQSVPPGTYTVIFQVTAPDGTVLAGTSVPITVGAQGQLVLERGLIDPYGVVTDSVTGKPVAGVKLSLYWADTPTNRAYGRIPNTLVQLPELPDFPPGQNRVPQLTNSAGEFAWMVIPDGWYYIVAEKDGYVTYDSRVEGRTVPAAAGEDSFIQNGLMYVGSAMVKYDLQLTPAGDTHYRYIKGYPDGQFKPEQSITRAEVATILTRITGRISAADNAALYPDVNPAHWAVPYIKAARARGLMLGDPDGKFRPDQPISRAEVAMIALRFKALQPLAIKAFPDTAGHWADSMINAVGKAGYVLGYPDGTYRPDQPITRAEFVTVINRLLGRGPLLGRPAPTFPDVTTEHWAYGQVEEAGTSHGFVPASDRTERWRKDIDAEID
jgi:hypothetical protein